MIQMGRKQRAALRKRMWLQNRPTMQRTALACAVLTGAMMLAMPQAQAQHAWQGATSDEWSNPGNWTSANGNVPGSTDAVEIDGTVANAPVVRVPGAVTGDLHIGRNGTGELTISNGGSLLTHGFATLYGTQANGQPARVRVTGAGSLWDVRNRLFVGQHRDGVDGGYGQLWVEQDGHLLTRGAEVAYGNATGRVSLSSGARWDNDTSVINIGNGGDGIVQLGSGAQLHSAGEIWLGINGGNGTLALAASGTELTARSLSVGTGHDGSRGQMQVLSGARVAIADTLQVGQGGGGVGTEVSGALIVEGVGSMLDAANLVVGRFATGTVDIREGGRLGTFEAIVGQEAGSIGTVRVHGGASYWGRRSTDNASSFGPSLHLGEAGSGRLEVSGGAIAHSRWAELGMLAAGNGTVRLDQGNWHVEGHVAVGGSGQGQVEVLNHSQMEVGTIDFAANTGSQGSLLVDSSRFDANGEMRLYGNSSVTARNGANVHTHGLVIGSNGITGGTATRSVLLEGAGSSWIDESWVSVGNFGDGQLLVGDGAAFHTVGTLGIGADAISTGLVQVRGQDSTLFAYNVEVGQQGHGRLNLLDGARATADHALVGAYAGSTGVLDVDANARLTVGELIVGENGNGNLHVRGGGEVQAGMLRIARANGSQGDVRVGADGFLTANALTVGDNSGHGVLRVDAGGEASIGGDAMFASRADSVGLADVAGTDARLHVSGALFVGQQGNGAIDVRDGAQLSVGGITRLGQQTGSQGQLEISGPGSNFNTATLLVGQQGNGRFAVDGGALAQVNYLLAGYQGAGQVAVHGTGSRLEIGNSGLMLGDQASAQMLVDAGGRVDIAGQTNLGLSNNGNGILEVSGAGSTLTHQDAFNIGYTGNGTLIVGQGGTVQAGTPGLVSTLGYEVGSSGSARVNGGTWNAGQHLQVGREGEGELTIGHGGTVSLENGGEVRLGMAGQAFGAFGGLYIGGYHNEAAAVAGTLDADDIHFQNGALVFNHTSQDYGFGARLHGGGNGAVGAVWTLAGHTRLTGNSAGFAGATTVSGGRLSVDGVLGGEVVVSRGGLGGSGRIGGDVRFTNNNGATALHGVQGDTLRIDGNLQLHDATRVQVALGTAGGSGLFDVGGDLVLDGTLDITDQGGFGAGIYRLFDYGGALTDNGLALGVLPGWADAGALSVQTSVAQQVNLVSELQAMTTFWDGGNSALWGNAQVDGGTGTWRADITSFTDSTGTATGPMQPVPGFAVFTGNAGTVTVDNGAGDAQVTGMQFATDGYVVQGDAITLAQSDAVVRVGDGTAAGAGYTARIDAALVGNGGLVKNDYGTLLLTGQNSYTGATVVRDGVLRLAEGGSLGGAGAIIGQSAGQDARVELEGAGTAWTIGGDLSVGQEGIGNLRVDNGAVVNVLGRTFLGQLSGAEGSLTLLDGARLNANGAYLHVGSAGRGTLLLDGGSALTSRNAYLGSLLGSQGTARLLDGSTWDVNGVLAVGWNGMGNLQALQGSRIDSTYGVIASGSASHGEATIDASQWNVDGYLAVGDTGIGQLIARNGARVTSGSGLVGAAATAQGTARIEGAGTRWNIATDLDVAMEGGGDLLVAGGAQVAVGGDASFGLLGGGGDTVVRGSGSRLDVAGHAVIGGEGSVVLALEDGGTFSAASAVLAESAGSFGLLNIGGDSTPAGAGTFDVAALHLGEGDARIILNHTGNGYRFDTDLIGNGAMTVRAGTTIFGGQVTGNVATLVEGGTLLVDGMLDGSTVVVGNGRLGGSGRIAGDTRVDLGGTLLGVQGQTLALDTLVLESGAVVNAVLGVADGGPGLFDVAGDLTLDGTLNVTNAGGFGPGVYRLFDYGGSLTDNGLVIGSVPGGVDANGLIVQTSVAQQVNLLADGGSALDYLFWDGGDSALWNNGQVDGGSGTWAIGRHSFTSVDGSGNGDMQPRPGFAIFQGAAGTVTVDNAGGDAQVVGMQFASDGYVVQGDAITLADEETVIRVGDGSAAGENWTATIHSNLVGGVDLAKSDRGTLVLTGDSDHTGNTRVDSGVLVGHAGNIRGNLVNNAVTVFRTAADQAWAGNITGTGSMSKEGAGELILGGNSAQDWRIDEGGIVTAAGRFGGNAQIDSGAWLAFYQNGNATYAGRLSGTGEFDVEEGHVRLTGNSSGFNGSTWVGNATLEVDGMLGGTLEIDADARLMGGGTVGSTTIFGTLAPGNSIGTLNVNGDLVFRSGATYEVEVDAAGNGDRVAVSGVATLQGGSVLALASGGNYGVQTAYTILTAGGGVNGTFGSIDSSLAFLTPSLAYSANAVTLTLDRNDVAFPDVALTPNQHGAAAGAESLGYGNEVYDAILTLDAGDARHAFDMMSGEIHAGAARMLLDDSRFIRDASLAQARDAFLGTPLQAKHQDERTGWVRGYGAWGSQDGDGNAAKAERSALGVLVGGDVAVGGQWRVGGALGYRQSTQTLRPRMSAADARSYELGAYAGWQSGAWGVRFGAAQGWHRMDTSRNVMAAGFGERLTADYGARTTQVFAETGRAFDVAGTLLEPFVNLAHVRVTGDAIAETGGATALNGRLTRGDDAFATVGARAARDIGKGNSAVTLRGSLAWRHAFDDAPEARLAFAGGDTFQVYGLAARNATQLELSMEGDVAENAKLSLSYKGMFGGGVKDNGLRLAFNWEF